MMAIGYLFLMFILSTVVGWSHKKVLLQLQESPSDVLLTLKKRPKHTKIYGQLGLIKLPSKKRSFPYRFDNPPSPRVELFNIPEVLIPLSKPLPEKLTSSDTEESSSNESDILTPIEVNSSEKDLRLYLPKPRGAVLQRRHSICGNDMMSLKNFGNLVLWHERKANKELPDSTSLRDKSVSFGFGLELTQRPTTCLGISQDNSQARNLKSSLPNMSNKRNKSPNCIPEQELDDSNDERNKSGVSKVVRFDSNSKLEEYNHDSKYICNVENTIIESFMPIPFVDEESTTTVDEAPKPAPRNFIENQADKIVEAINSAVVNRENIKRGRLDKSHSTPTYDSNDTGM